MPSSLSQALKSFLTVFALLLSLSGCASLPSNTVKPYVRPLASSTLEQRKQVLQAHSVYTPGGFTHVGSEEAFQNLDEYFRKSGSPQAAEKLSGSRLPFLLGFAGGLALALTQANEDQGISKGLALGLPILVLGSWAGDYFYTKPAVEAFNSYLRHDMGLPPDTQATDPLALNENSRDASGQYMLFTFGGLMSQGQDVADFITPPPGGGLAPNPTPEFPVQLLLGGGKTYASGFGYEGLASLGTSTRIRVLRVDPGFGNTPYDLKLSMIFYSLQVAPGFTWSSGFPGRKGRAVYWLGAGLGGAWAFVDPSYLNTIASGGTYGGGSWLANPQFRISFPSSRRASWGLELGYRYCKLASVTTGGLFSPASSLMNARGQEASFDFSGPYVSLALQVGRLGFTR